jgi:hypothetical protein
MDGSNLFMKFGIVTLSGLYETVPNLEGMLRFRKVGGFGADFSSVRTPLSRSFPRDSRDITVPTGIPSVVDISL